MSEKLSAWLPNKFYIVGDIVYENDGGRQPSLYEAHK